MGIDISDVISWDDIVFIDCETRSYAHPDDPGSDITKTTAQRYGRTAFPIIITWAFGLDGEIKRWVWEDFDNPPAASDLPQELRDWDGFFAAWNSGFDRAVLDKYLKAGIHGWLDMMAHAAYNNLPLGLDRAAKACGLPGKVSLSKKIMTMFCASDGEGRPDTHRELWDKFCVYADGDVEQMQGVAAATFPVPYAIWEQFWVSEAINDRGLPIDVTMAQGGAVLAAEYGERSNARIAEITDGALFSIRQYQAQRSWVWERLQKCPFKAEMVEASRILEDGTEEFKLSMDRQVIIKLIAGLTQRDEEYGLTDDEFAALQLLEEREYGASAAPAKFQKMLNMEIDGRIPGQYVFSGATQTGRFSSRGVQTHNMTRSTVGKIEREEDVALFMIDVGEAEELRTCRT